MAQSFSQLRKQSSNLEALQKKVQSQGKKDYSDDRFWRAQTDKAGNGSAVIRFLPASQGEESPFVKVWSFGFKGADATPNSQATGPWFIENSPTTIGKPCPVCESNNELWNTGNKDDENLARKRKRKLSYISNILVVKDPANPENEGKVFLFKYGQKIFEKLENAMVPKFDDEDPINVFNPWDGANFKLRIAKVAGYANYDSSAFDNVAPIGKDDEIESIWKSQHSLEQFLAEDQFKSYDELKTRFEKVIGGVSLGAASVEDELESEADTELPSVDEKESLDSLAEDEIESIDDIDTDIDDFDDFKSLVSDD